MVRLKTLFFVLRFKASLYVQLVTFPFTLFYFLLSRFSSTSFPASVDQRCGQERNPCSSLVNRNWPISLAPLSPPSVKSIGVIDTLVCLGYISCGVSGWSMLGGPIGICSAIPCFQAVQCFNSIWERTLCHAATSWELLLSNTAIFETV